jgi:hypothetical protein
MGSEKKARIAGSFSVIKIADRVFDPVRQDISSDELHCEHWNAGGCGILGHGDSRSEYNRNSAQHQRHDTSPKLILRSNRIIYLYNDFRRQTTCEAADPSECSKTYRSSDGRRPTMAQPR